MSIKACIGIDFGTTKTSACKYVPGAKQPEMICLQGGQTEVPTLIALDETTGEVKGWGIDITPDWKDGIIFDCFKLDTGKKSVKLHRCSSGEINVAEVFFKEVFEAICRHFGGAPDNHASGYEFIVGCPTDWTKTQRKQFLDTIQKAGIQSVELLEESCAVSKYHQWNLGINLGNDLFFVFDFGGATLNMGVFRPQKGGNDKVAVYGIDIGGKDFDEKLLEYYYHKTPTFRDKAEKNRIGAKNHCKRLKEKFSCNISDGKIGSTSLPWNGEDLSLEKNEFDDMCGNLVNKIQDAIDKMLDEANIEPNEIKKILTSGGSSQFYFVRQVLKEFFPHILDDDIIYSTNSNLVVAKGLAVSKYATACDVKQPIAEVRGKQTDFKPRRHYYTLGITGYFRHTVEFDIHNDGLAGNIEIICTVTNSGKVIGQFSKKEFFNMNETRHYTCVFKVPDINTTSDIVTHIP